MLDALKKRCTFVHAAALHLGVANVETVWSRAEDSGRDQALREVSPHPSPPRPASPRLLNLAAVAAGTRPSGVLRMHQ